MFVGLQIAMLNPAKSDVKAKSDEDEAVITIATMGHQPVLLGGLYSAVQSEFLPGRNSISPPVLNNYELRHESLDRESS